MGLDSLVAGLGCLLGVFAVMILVRTFQKLFIDPNVQILGFIFPDIKILFAKLGSKCKHKI